MTIAAPQGISPVSLSPAQELNLRPFQRLTAEIMQVSNVQAVLSINGYPVVARLSSPQQAAELMMQKSARFIVTQMDDETIVLKLVRPGQSPDLSESLIVPVKDLATRLLEQNGLPANLSNLMMTRAGLNQGLPINQSLLNEMGAALFDLGVWGQNEADLAAAIKAAGLPLSTGSIVLAGRMTVQLGDSLAEIVQALQNAASRPGLSSDVKQMIQTSLQTLQASIPDWGSPVNQLADSLTHYVQLMGRSVENILREGVQNQNSLASDKNLLSLVHLQQALSKIGETDLSRNIGRFLDDVRQNLLMNVKPDPVPGRGEWNMIGLVLKTPDNPAEPQNVMARFRVSRQSSQKKGISLDYTHIIIQVDLSENTPMQVDLSLAGHQARAAVTAPDPALSNRARDELPGLEEGLQKLGYSLKEAQVDIGIPPAFESMPVSTNTKTPLTAVDLEV
ncbi:MAG: hypothetical protein P4L50_01595 [Anaerolineaceae bacterium]|nr:hypothetical protein [Anaerolineaceae bacterium]